MARGERSLEGRVLALERIFAEMVEALAPTAWRWGEHPNLVALRRRFESAAAVVMADTSGVSLPRFVEACEVYDAMVNKRFEDYETLVEMHAHVERHDAEAWDRLLKRPPTWMSAHVMKRRAVKAGDKPRWPSIFRACFRGRGM